MGDVLAAAVAEGWDDERLEAQLSAYAARHRGA